MENPPDPSPKFPQFIPPPVFPNLSNHPYWQQQIFPGLLKVAWAHKFEANIHSTYNQCKRAQ